KKFNGSVDFHRTWTEYKNGFGDASGEYWLGNEALHQLTKSGGPYEWIFKATAFDGTVQVSRYDDFSIGNESTNYLLSVGALTHGSMASLTNKSPFTTYDNDNDLALSFNCAFRGDSGNYKNGGFWYEKCGGFQPNAQYSNNVGGVYQKFIFWKNFRGKSESLKATSMRFRKKP
uniref:Fibrinogen C-terminal domain-containing protein n=1 Tax=Clytia hemisphaerica TaxID=252671 RepID=A0A7M5X1L9_9CNID